MIEHISILQCSDILFKMDSVEITSLWVAFILGKALKTAMEHFFFKFIYFERERERERACE